MTVFIYLRRLFSHLSLDWLFFITLFFLLLSLLSFFYVYILVLFRSISLLFFSIRFLLLSSSLLFSSPSIIILYILIYQVVYNGYSYQNSNLTKTSKSKYKIRHKSNTNDSQDVHYHHSLRFLPSSVLWKLLNVVQSFFWNVFDHSFGQRFMCNRI